MHLSRDAQCRRLSRRVSFPVSSSDIRRWALASALPPEPPPREFVDADYATTRWGGLVAPREFNPFAWMVAERAGPDVQVARDDPDLTEIVLDIKGPYLKFQLNGDCALSTGCRCDLARRQ